MIDQEMDMATCKEDRNRETNVVKLIRKMNGDWIRRRRKRRRILPYCYTSVKNPLKNDKNNSPENEIWNSKPRESLHMVEEFIP